MDKRGDEERNEGRNEGKIETGTGEIFGRLKKEGTIDVWCRMYSVQYNLP